MAKRGRSAGEDLAAAMVEAGAPGLGAAQEAGRVEEADLVTVAVVVG